MQYFAAFGGEKKVIERRPSAEPKGTVAGGKASAGWREASAEPKLTEKAEPELTLKEETEFRN